MLSFNPIAVSNYASCFNCTPVGLKAIHLSLVRADAFYAPNFEKVGSILLSPCPCVSVCVRPSVQKKLKLGF